jgi:hypothetical protein
VRNVDQDDESAEEVLVEEVLEEAPLSADLHNGGGGKRGRRRVSNARGKGGRAKNEGHSGQRAVTSPPLPSSVSEPLPAPPKLSNAALSTISAAAAAAGLAAAAAQTAATAAIAAREQQPQDAALQAELGRLWHTVRILQSSQGDGGMGAMHGDDAGEVVRLWGHVNELQVRHAHIDTNARVRRSSAHIIIDARRSLLTLPRNDTK